MPRAGTFDKIGEVGGTVCIGRIPVSPGDWVLADEMGVIVAPKARVADCFEAARAVYEKEEYMAPLLRAGQGFPEIVAGLEAAKAAKKAKTI